MYQTRLKTKKHSYDISEGKQTMSDETDRIKTKSTNFKLSPNVLSYINGSKELDKRIVFQIKLLNVNQVKIKK